MSEGVGARLQPLGGQLLLEKGVQLRLVGDHGDVGRVAFVAGARMRNVLQLDTHDQLST